MVAKYELRTTKRYFRTTAEVQEFVGETLAIGLATEIRIYDDRGGLGEIVVAVTKPKE